MQPFVAADDSSGDFVAGLSTPERLVLAQVTGDVVELLGGEEGVFGEDDTAEFDPRDLLPVEPGPPSQDVGGQHGGQRPHLSDFLDGIDDQVVLPPSDPAVRRLLPDASHDPEIAKEFRRFTDDDLRQCKVDRLLLLAELLLEEPPSRDEAEQLTFVVAADEAEAIAGALGDIRQVIGARLDLHTDADTEILIDAVTATWTATDQPDDLPADQLPRPHAGEALSGPTLFLGSVFLLAGFLQESLVERLLARQRRKSDGD